MATTQRARPQAMTLTDAAADRIRQIMEKSEEGVLGLRLGVKNGGCAGMEYTMEWAREQKPFEEVVEDKGVRVFLDPKAVLFLLGTQMDYQSTTLKSGFVFNNPNQVSACGCGESVTLKPAEQASP
jgi:iron-sulfur cluster assembly protein